MLNSHQWKAAHLCLSPYGPFYMQPLSLFYNVCEWGAGVPFLRSNRHVQHTFFGQAFYGKVNFISNPEMNTLMPILSMRQLRASGGCAGADPGRGACRRCSVCVA